MGRTQDHQANHALTGERFSGLYNAAYEHDACGVGMVVNILLPLHPGIKLGYLVNGC